MITRRAFSLSLAASAASAAALALPHIANASTDYPNRAVKIICPFAPGGSGDISARLFAEHFKPATNQTLVVENRAGASGGVGAAAVKSADADGYTLMLSTSSVIVANELFYKTLPYDPNDFATVGIIGAGAMFMMVNPSAPYKTPAEFIAYAKANPNAITSAHFNTSSRIGAAIFAARAGLKFNEIPYKDVGVAVSDLIAGRISLIFMDTVAGTQHLQSGSLKAIAVTSGERFKQTPDVPTVSETFPNTEILAFLSVSVRKEVSQEIQQKLNTLVNGMVKDPAIVPRLDQLGMITKQMDLAAVNAFVEVERKRWQDYVKTAGIQRE